MLAVNMTPLLTLAALVAALPTLAYAETPASLCHRLGTDDTTHPIPQALVPAVNAAFATHMPARTAMDTTLFRCADHRVMVCTIGANLPCGEADTSRTPNPGVAQWCHDNPDVDFVPAAVTGHATIYAWRCQAGAPQIARQALHVDPRGFVAEYWKPLP